MSQAVTASSVGFTGGQFAVGLSSCIGLTGGAGQLSVELQYTAGQTIWIAGSSVAFGVGMLWGVTIAPVQYFPEYRGDLFFTAAGATALVSWWKDLSNSPGNTT